MSKNPLPEHSLPFIDYYDSHGVVPVSQDISDFEQFLFRRNYLYTTLGFPLARLKNLNIVEIGPGTGHNAIATSFFSPTSYTFIDGSIVSIRELEDRCKTKKFNAKNIEILYKNFLEYEPSRKYDLVICEGTLPGQDKPTQFLKKLSSCVDTGGGLIVTTTSSPSILSEVCRRVLRPFILASCKDFEESIRLTSEVFDSHLNSLGVSRRSTKDWVVDVILQDFYANRYILSILDVVEIISDEFDFYNSSPSFLIDDRWYKKVNPTGLSRTDLLKNQYTTIGIAMLDCRVSMDSVLQIRDKSSLTQVELICNELCLLHDKILRSNSLDKIDDFILAINHLTSILPEEFLKTKVSLNDYIRVLSELLYSGNLLEFDAFKEFWGRGQQYASFLKKIQDIS
jgi:hypothetical protein